MSIPTKTCAICGLQYNPNGYHSKYCKECAIQELRRIKRNWMRNARATPPEKYRKIEHKTNGYNIRHMNNEQLADFIFETIKEFSATQICAEATDALRENILKWMQQEVEA